MTLMKQMKLIVVAAVAFSFACGVEVADDVQNDDTSAVRANGLQVDVFDRSSLTITSMQQNYGVLTVCVKTRDDRSGAYGTNYHPIQESVMTVVGYMGWGTKARDNQYSDGATCFYWDVTKDAAEGTGVTVGISHAGDKKLSVYVPLHKIPLLQDDEVAECSGEAALPVPVTRFDVASNTVDSGATTFSFLVHGEDDCG